MKILCAPAYPDPVDFAEIIKHPVKKIMLIRPDNGSVVRPHQYVGIIAANDTLRPDYICDLID